jgi:uncharacterized protein YecE (DUF72 family)
MRIGPCSWSDKSLIACKRFYPRGCSTPEARLRYYAAQFPLVEVDSSYYAMPSVENAQRWVERTPADFVFNIKAFRLLTLHPTQPQVLPPDLQPAWRSPARFYYRDVPAEVRTELWRRFREALAPLQQAGKLGLVHFQFAPWLTRGREAEEHVRHCIEMMAGHTLSVEFRHASWFSERNEASTLAFERELGVVHTVVDAPQGFANSVPQVWAATHPELAYVRLHGRNAATWNIKGASSASERFDYDYPLDEIEALAGSVRRLADLVPEAHIVFNNNAEDQGQRNARALMQALGIRR